MTLAKLKRDIKSTHINFLFSTVFLNSFVRIRSTGGDMRELKNLSETTSEYREPGEDSDSESYYRWIMVNDDIIKNSCFTF